MTILVTGSNGFLGAALVERLLAHGERGIRCLVRQGSDRSRLEAVQARHPEGSLDIFLGSLGSSQAAAEALEGVDTVYHLAASLSGSAADMFLNTVVTSKNLLEACAQRPDPIKIVLVSSFGVYGVAGLGRGAVVDEQTPLEPHPEQRDLYSHAKLRQEQLFWEYHSKRPFPLVVLRPGVIYGPSGSALSARIGISLPGVFLYLGGDNLLPLSYVDNCAEAIAVAGRSEAALGEIYNVHDDELPTCGQYFAEYQQQVAKVRSLRVPYPLLRLGSWLVKHYHAYSQGQLPAIFTPYKTATSWGGNRFENRKLRALGWRQLISTDEGMRRTFADLRERAGGGSS